MRNQQTRNFSHYSLLASGHVVFHGKGLGAIRVPKPPIVSIDTEKETFTEETNAIAVVFGRNVFLGSSSEFSELIKVGGVGGCSHGECARTSCQLECQNAGEPIAIPLVDCRHNGNNIPSRNSAFNSGPLDHGKIDICVSECGFACQ